LGEESGGGVFLPLNGISYIVIDVRDWIHGFLSWGAVTKMSWSPRLLTLVKRGRDIEKIGYAFALVNALSEVSGRGNNFTKGVGR